MIEQLHLTVICTCQCKYANFVCIITTIRNRKYVVFGNTNGQKGFVVGSVVQIPGSPLNIT